MTFRKLLPFLVIPFFIKIILSYFTPIVGDEAYYWFWSQNLQLSYFDHPAMIAWIIKISSEISKLIHLPDSLGLRLAMIFISTYTFYIWFKLFNFENDKSKQSVFLFTSFYMLNPLLGFGGIIATPDIPLMLFWALSALTVKKIIQHHRSLDYALLGLFLGLGFCSKYHIVLFPMTYLAYFIINKKISQFHLKKVGLTLFFGLIFSLPVLIWNYQNDFSSFKFQLSHGLGSSENASQYNWLWTASYLLSQIVIFNPVLIYELLRQVKNNFSKSLSIYQWLFFIYSSFKAKVEANWPIVSHAHALQSLSYNNTKIIRWAFTYWIVIWLTIVGLFFTPLGQKKILALPTSLTVKDIYPEIKSYSPLYGPTYQISSLISLMTDLNVPKLPGLSRYDFFDAVIETPVDPKFYVIKYESTTWPNQYNGYRKTKLESFEKYKLELYELVNE